MRVLYVTNMYPSHENDYYGVFVKEQIDYLKSKLSIEDSVYYINARKTIFSYLKSIFLVNLKILKGNFDVIHVHYGLSALFLLLNLWTPKRKLIITLHGGDILFAQKKYFQVLLTKLLLFRFGGIICLNPNILTQVKFYNGMKIVIPCGVDAEFFIPKDNGSAENCPFRVVFPGYPERWVKNFKLFKKIIEQLSFELTIQVEPVVLKGLSRSQVLNALQTSDCILMTSFSEASPQVIKEALACNLPIISTNVGDVSENIEGLPLCGTFDHDDINTAVHLLKKIFNKSKSNFDLRSRVFERQLDQYSVCKKVLNAYTLINTTV